MSVRLKLQLVTDARPGHVFFLHVEEPARGTTAMVDGALVDCPWLRPACSCGWVCEERYTIEENAHFQWMMHTKEGTP